MTPGKRREKLQFQARPVGDDGYGNESGPFATVFTEYAELLPLKGGGESVLASRLSGVQPYIIRVPGSTAARNVKGRSLSEEQSAAIEKKVALYRQYSDMLARTKLAQDLLEERRFNTLSAQDQKITTTLKQYGRPTDLNSQEAKDVRNSLNANDLADGIKSFGMEFSGGLLTQGKDLGEAFGDAVKNAAQDQMQKSLDSLFGQIGNALAQSIFGGPSAVPGVASAAVPMASVAGSVFGKAPVGAVSRSALPDVGMTKAGEALSQISTGGGLTASVNKKYAANFLASRRTGANDNGQPGILQVQIMGANGDEHVKALVQQGVSDGLGKYNKDQERGGFGTTQGQFSKRKG